MWYIRLLKSFLGHKVPAGQKKQLYNAIDSVFNSYVQQSPPIFEIPEFECMLHVLCYMQRIYSNTLPNQNSIIKIKEDLAMSIILAEKVANDEAVWLLDFCPGFGTTEELQKNERSFLKHTLHYHTMIKKRELLALLSLADTTIIAEFKFYSALAYLSSKKEEFSTSSKKGSLLDGLSDHPLLVDKNSSDLYAVTKGLKLINRCPSIDVLKQIQLSPALLEAIQQLFTKYKQRCQQQSPQTLFYNSKKYFKEQNKLADKIVDLLDDYNEKDSPTAHNLFKMLGACLDYDQQRRVRAGGFDKTPDLMLDLTISKAFELLERFIAADPKVSTISSKGLYSSNHLSTDESLPLPQNASPAFS